MSILVIAQWSPSQIPGWSASTVAADYERLRKCETWRSDRDRLDWEGRIPTFLWTFSPFCSCFNFQGVEVSIVPFTTMRHGFLTRGNMEDPEVAAEVLFSSIFGLSRRNMFAQIVAGVNFLSQCFCTSALYPTHRCQGLWTLLWTSSRSTLENNK